MAQSRDWQKLADVWQAWRRATGDTYKDNFTEMIRLSNKAAQIEGYIGAPCNSVSYVHVHACIGHGIQCLVSKVV